MTTNHGDFIWYELNTTDADTAKAFYSGLLGWTFEDADSNAGGYQMFCAGEHQVGGLLPMTKEMTDGGARPVWLGYVQVSGLPAAVAKVRELGGNVVLEGMEAPGVGPFAMITDPQGAMLYLIDDQSGEQSAAFSKHEPQDGTCAWNELATSDPDAADTFYHDLFGWTKGDGMEMGPLGFYQMYNHDDYGLGAMMKKPDEMPMPLWAYYFRVPDIDVAKDYVEANGGSIANGPMEIPGGDFVFQGFDPAGAFFSLIGKRSS